MAFFLTVTLKSFSSNYSKTKLWATIQVYLYNLRTGLITQWQKGCRYLHKSVALLVFYICGKYYLLEWGFMEHTSRNRCHADYKMIEINRTADHLNRSVGPPADKINKAYVCLHACMLPAGALTTDHLSSNTSARKTFFEWFLDYSDKSIL